MDVLSEMDGILGLIILIFFKGGSMFSLKPNSMSFDLLSYEVSEMVINSRASVIKNVFEEVESIHAETYEYAEKMDSLEDIEYDYNDQYALKMHELDHFFFRINRSSTILSLYDFLENTLMSICAKKQQQMDLKISVSQLNGAGVCRCKACLESYNIFDFSKPEIKQYWDLIQSFNKVRNSLAHTEGNIDNFAKLKKETINGTKGLHVEGSGTLMISKEYVIKHIDNVRDFLLALCK